jgi:Flp pilus assembly protein TadD
MAQKKGNAAQAIETYRAVLKLDPLSPIAINNLATLLAQSGQLNEAETLWRQTFAINQTTEEPGINLASVQCLLGEKDAAAGTLRQVLVYNPDRKSVRQKLRAIESGKESCSGQKAK